MPTERALLPAVPAAGPPPAGIGRVDSDPHWRAHQRHPSQQRVVDLIDEAVDSGLLAGQPLRQ